MTTPPNEPKQEILPCPFCGKIPFITKNEYFDNWFIECGSLGCSTKPRGLDYQNKNEAIRIWNLRLTPQPSRESELLDIIRQKDAALRPFAQMAEKFMIGKSNWPEDTKLYGHEVVEYHNFLTLGDCLKAQQALALTPATPQPQAGGKGEE